MLCSVLFSSVVLTDSGDDISSSPAVVGQGIGQRERSVSGPSNARAHGGAAQLQSDLMHDFA